MLPCCITRFFAFYAYLFPKLQRYCWLESLCRLLQQEVAGGVFAREHYVGGVRVSAWDGVKERMQRDI